jgi:hypothetical protein
MSFFDSEVVRSEIAEISELQERIYESVFKFPHMNSSDKLDHVKMLEKLIDKQKILYTRLSLSDDPEAVKMKERILDSAKMMGLSSDVDMNVVFNNMNQMLQVMKNSLDSDGST